MADESTINFEDLGVLISTYLLVSEAFLCVLGVNFAESMELPRQSRPNKLHRSSYVGLAYGGAIIRPVGISIVLCTSGYATLILYIRSPAA
jgi:hypothetical protein